MSTLMIHGDIESLNEKIMLIFHQGFQYFEVPAGIVLIDDNNNLLLSINCQDILFYQKQIVTIVDIFKSTRDRFESSFEDSLNLKTLKTMKNVYYVFNLLINKTSESNKLQLYLVIYSTNEQKIFDLIPFIDSIVKKLNDVSY